MGEPDPLSPAVRKIMALDIDQAYTQLVVRSAGSASARTLLEKLTPQSVGSLPLRSEPDAKALLAALWLWHDWLDEAHRIVQDLPGPTGSLWHAIMHRREGDFSNSKYWYARCPGFPVFPAIHAHANALINPLPAEVQLLRLVHNGWNPDAFVDLVEIVHNQPTHPLSPAVTSLQQIEWRLLFDHCTRLAFGA